MKKVWITVALAALFLLAVGAAAADSLSITGCTTDYAGHITLRWQGGTAPFRVTYSVVGFEDHRWNCESGLYSRYLTVVDFVPDTNYIFYVTDSSYEQDSVVRAAYRKPYTDISGMRLTLTPRQKINGRAATVTGYSASDIRNSLFNTQQRYGATIKFSYDRIASARKAYCRMVMVMPNGEPLVFSCGELTLSAGTGGSGYSYYDFYDFAPVWQTVYSVYGDIPTGTYIYRLYLDDGYVGEKAITVTR